MATGRYLYTGVVLANGDLLAAGGCTASACATTTALAERFLISSEAWVSAGSLSVARASAMGALLPDGDALVAGGCTASSCTADVEIYSATANTFSAAAPLPMPWGYATSTVLSDGRVLVTGGCTDAACASVLANAAVYDPTGDSWSSAGTLTTPRAAHTASLLANGDVLIAGGCADAACANTLQSTEIWSPAGGGTTTAAPPMLVARHNHTSTTLGNGDVLVAGGLSAAGATSPMAEVFLPIANYWYDTTGMIMDRAYHTGVKTASGNVLVAGGCNPATCIPFAEVYSPASLPPDVDGGMPPPPIDAGPSNQDAGPPPVYTPGTPHPALYREDVVTCATSTAQDLTCPQPGYGLEDGDFQPNLRPLTPEGGEVLDEIFDPATGLTWQAGDSGATGYTNAGAAAYCVSFSTSGTPAGEWRLPSVVELFTINDYAVYLPSTNKLFQNTQPANYWSSTGMPGNPMLAWTVKFDFGEVIPLLLDTPLPVRCVHGPPLQNATGKLRLAGPLVAATDTVVDSTTGLEWQRQDDATKRTWQESLAYCAALSLDGESNWHLPNVEELFGLVEFDVGSVYATAIDRAFPTAKADLYWTGSQNEGVPTLSWSVNFNAGVVDGVTVSGYAYARCVRHLSNDVDGGQPDAGSSDAGHSDGGELDGGRPRITTTHGCGCSGPGVASGALLLFLAVALGRRRRRSPPHPE